LPTSLQTRTDVRPSGRRLTNREVIQPESTGRTSFFSGVMVLTISNLLVKLLGMLFKIPMNYIVGDTGMGYYNAAYTIYTFFYMLSTAGLPAAVAIMVSAARSERKWAKSRLVLRAALLLFCLIGTFGTAILFLFPDALAALTGAPPASVSILAVAPTLFFVCIASALKGYFQGCSRMTPTAVSQLLEALCKVGAGILGAVYAVHQGYPPHIIAAYAVLGLTLGTGISMLYLIAAWFRSHETISDLPSVPEKREYRPVFRQLAAIAVPVTVSSAVMSLTGLIDAVLIQRLLQHTGMTQEAATTVYGNYTSLAVPMFNMPPALVYPIAYAIVPLLTKYHAAGESGMADKQQKTASALRMASIIGTPCAMGMTVLAKPILSLLYRESSAETAAPLLTLLAPSSLLVCVLAITNAVLQSIGKAKLPVYSMLAGAAVKILTTILLIPVMGIRAAPISTFLCYLTVTAWNLFFLLRHMEMQLRMSSTFFLPLLAAGCCSACACLTYQLMASHLSEKIAVLTAIVLAAVVYFLMIRVLHILQPEDLELLPKNQKLRKWLHIQETEKSK